MQSGLPDSPCRSLVVTEPPSSLLDLRNLVLQLLELLGLVAAGVGQREENFVAGLGLVVDVVKVAVASDAASKYHVLLHYRLAVGMDRAQVSVLEDTNKVGLSGFLKSDNGLALEAHVGVEVLSDVLDETQKGSARNDGFDLLLVLLDLAKGGGAGLLAALDSVLHAALSGCGLLLDGLGLARVHLLLHLGGGLLRVADGFGCNF